MNRDRSSFSAVCLLVCLAWASLAWLMPRPAPWPHEQAVLWHRIASVALATGLAIHLFLAVTFQRSD